MESHVQNGAVSAENADTSSSSSGINRHTLDDVGAGGDLEYVGTEGVGAVSGDDDGWFGLVFGSGRAASWASAGGGCCCRIGVGVVALVRGFGGIGRLLRVVGWVLRKRDGSQLQLGSEPLVHVPSPLPWRLIPRHSLFFSVKEEEIE